MSDTWTNPYNSLKGFFFPGEDKNVPQALRQKIALAMLMQKKAYPKNFGEGLAAIGDSLGDLGTMRRLEADAAAGETAATEAEKRLSGPLAYAPDDNTVERFDKEGARFIPPRAAPAIEPQANPNRRVIIQTPPPRPVEDAPQPAELQLPNTEAPIATVQPRSLQPPPGPAALAQSMSPSQNPLLNQYPVEPAANAPFPGPDVASQQVPASVAMRQPPMAPPPAQGAIGGAPPAWFPQAKGNIGQMQALQPHPTGMPPSQGAFGPQAAAPPLPDPRTDVAMSLAQRGPGGPPSNPMLGGQIPASMPRSPLPPPGPASPSLATVGSPPEAAQNRPITMSDVNPMPLRPGMQLAQAGGAGAPPAPRPAPRAAPRPAPQENVPDPGYVTPLPPTRPPPPTMTDTMQRIQEEVRRAPPAYRDSVRERLKPVYDNEVAKLKTVHEAYKDQLIEDRAQTQMHHQQKAAARASVDAARAAELNATKSQQEIDRGKSPDRVTHEGQIYERGTDGKWVDVTPGGGDRAPKLTEGQAKDLGFYERGRRALADLGEGEKLGGWYEWYASGMPVIGNSLVSKEFQGQLNAAREFAAIVLRRESGAAVTDKELNQVIDRYLPKPGTDPQTAIQKQFMREGQVQSFRDALGDKAVAADRFDKRFEIERQLLTEEKAKLAGAKAKLDGTATPSAADPLEGREAVWPDKTIRVRRNGQWVPK